MPRAPRSIAKRARHKKWLKRAKGFRGRRHTVFKLAKESVLKAGQYAYRDRRKKKTLSRQGWHITINAAVRPYGMSYSKFMHQLRQQGIELDRKVLAELAQDSPDIFKQVVTAVQEKAGHKK